MGCCYTGSSIQASGAMVKFETGSMDRITLRILDGADRGRTYNNVGPPITIGREEGNTIQLNDERVSRFHIKIQQDHRDLVLTDLESTNGTKVNGEETQLRILKHGDMISVGRSTILFGSRSEINQRLGRLDGASNGKNKNKVDSGVEIDFDSLRGKSDIQLKLLELDPPKLPSRLSPGQAAQLAEVLEFIHLQLRRLVTSVNTEPRAQKVEMDIRQWHYLLDLQARLAEYLRNVAIPEE